MYMRTSTHIHTLSYTLLVLLFHTYLYISCEFSAAKNRVTICGWLAFIALKKKKKHEEMLTCITHIAHAVLKTDLCRG